MKQRGNEGRRWSDGVEDSIKIVENRRTTAIAFNYVPAYINAHDEILIFLRAMLERGDYGDRSSSTGEFKAPEKTYTTCLQCGLRFEASVGDPRFCHDAHRDAWWADREKLATVQKPFGLKEESKATIDESKTIIGAIESSVQRPMEKALGIPHVSHESKLQFEIIESEHGDILIPKDIKVLKDMNEPKKPEADRQNYEIWTSPAAPSGAMILADNPDHDVYRKEGVLRLQLVNHVYADAVAKFHYWLIEQKAERNHQ